MNTDLIRRALKSLWARSQDEYNLMLEAVAELDKYEALSPSKKDNSFDIARVD